MFVCKICGHVHFGENPPESCPVCHAQAKAFTRDKEAVKYPSDADNPTESEKKHQPVITIQSGSGSQIINISVGDILHPMEKDHWIMFIDLYVDGCYQSRTAFPSESGLSPVVEKLWNQKSFEEVKAVACCNKHGRWAATLKQKTVEEEAYKCAGCGMTSTTKQHLCSPVKAKTFTCSYCGQEVDDARHVCKPKIHDMSYVCEACGRMAAGSDDLCMPNEIT